MNAGSKIFLAQLESINKFDDKQKISFVFNTLCVFPKSYFVISEFSIVFRMPPYRYKTQGQRNLKK